MMRALKRLLLAAVTGAGLATTAQAQTPGFYRLYYDLSSGNGVFGVLLTQGATTGFYGAGFRDSARPVGATSAGIFLTLTGTGTCAACVDMLIVPNGVGQNGEPILSGSNVNPLPFGAEFLPTSGSIRFEYGANGGAPVANTYGVGVTLAPEPSSYALMATGLLGLVAVARRQRRV